MGGQGQNEGAVVATTPNVREMLDRLVAQHFDANTYDYTSAWTNGVSEQAKREQLSKKKERMWKAASEDAAVWWKTLPFQPMPTLDEMLAFKPSQRTELAKILSNR